MKDVSNSTWPASSGHGWSISKRAQRRATALLKQHDLLEVLAKHLPSRTESESKSPGSLRTSA